MTRLDLTRADPIEGPTFGQSRARVLAILHEARSPLGVGEIARRLRLHPNTTRFHLDALIKAGLVERGTEDRDKPGRPRLLYTASMDGIGTSRRSYRLLAEILASYLASEINRPDLAALIAGEA